MEEKRGRSEVTSISLPPYYSGLLDELAETLAAPGERPNASAALRWLLAKWKRGDLSQPVRA